MSQDSAGKMSVTLRARERRRLAREGLGRRIIKTPGGGNIDEIGEAYKLGQQLATRTWIGMNPFRPVYSKLDRGTALVALDLMLDDALDAALQLLGFRKPDFKIVPDTQDVNESYRRGFVNQLKDYLSHEGRKHR